MPIRDRIICVGIVGFRESIAADRHAGHTPTAFAHEAVVSMEPDAGVQPPDAARVGRPRRMSHDHQHSHATGPHRLQR